MTDWLYSEREANNGSLENESRKSAGINLHENLMWHMVIYAINPWENNNFQSFLFVKCQILRLELPNNYQIFIEFIFATYILIITSRMHNFT